MALPSDSTIASVFHRLGNASAYVPAVYGKINASQRSNPPAHVRIGITGDGSYPNYRIEHAGGRVGPFNGRVPTELLANMGQAQEEKWSTAVMSFDEVKTLLLQLRKGAA